MANSTKSIAFQGPTGERIAVEVVDTGLVDGRGNVLYRLAVDTTLSVGPVSIGAVNIQDQNSLVNADVETITSVTESSHGVAVQAPVLGITTDTVDKVGIASTINAKMRGLVQLIAAGLPASLGQKAMTASLPVVIASDQGALAVTLASNVELGEVRLLDGLTGNLGQIDAVSAIAETGATKQAVHDPTVGITTGAAVVTDVAGTVQQYLRGLVKLFAARIPVSGQAAMAASLPVVIASDQSSVATTHSAVTVSPTDQASTASYVDFAGSTIDSLLNEVLSYTLLNEEVTNSITWQVLAANAVNFSDSVVAQTGAAVAAGIVGTYTANPPLYRYYKVQIRDTVGGVHATSQLRGIARG